MERPPPVLKPKGRFFGELESARGIAALLVAGFHCARIETLIAGTKTRLFEIEETNALWQVLRSIHQVIVEGPGQIHHGVLLFFVLSGFLLTDSLRQGPSSLGRAGGRFFLARLLRIYPAIIATILVFWLAYAIAGIALDPNGYSTGSILRNLFLLQTNIDGVMWTLQVELRALPLIFFAFILKSRAGLGPLVMLSAALALLSFSGGQTKFAFYSPWRDAWLYMFLFGVVAYYLGRKFGPTLDKRKATSVFLVSVFAFFMVGTVIHNKWQMLFQTFAGSAMIAVLAFSPPLWATAPLRARPLRFLGRVSYSFYLLHPLTLAVTLRHPALFGSWLEAGVPAILISIGLWVATTLAILPLAWLSYRTVELPCIRFGRRLWQLASTQA